MNTLHHPGLLPASEHFSRRKFASNPSCGILSKQAKGDTVSKQQWLRQARLLGQLRQHTACSAQAGKNRNQEDVHSYKDNELDENIPQDADFNNDNDQDDNDDDAGAQALWERRNNNTEDGTASDLRRTHLSDAARVSSNGSSNADPELYTAQPSLHDGSPNPAATSSADQAFDTPVSQASTGSASAPPMPSTAAREAETDLLTSSSSYSAELEAASNQADSISAAAFAEGQSRRLQSGSVKRQSNYLEQRGDPRLWDKKSGSLSGGPAVEAARTMERSSLIGRAKASALPQEEYGLVELFGGPDVSIDQYYEGARQIMNRLRPAIDMEELEGKASVQLLYSKSKTNELARQGVILVGLRANLVGTFYGDVLWKFTLPPEAPSKESTAKVRAPRVEGGSVLSARAKTATKKEAADNSTDGAEAGDKKQGSSVKAPDRALPFNRFRAKESVVITDMKRRAISSSEQGGYVTGTISEVGRYHMMIVLEREVSDQMEDFVDALSHPRLPNPARFRLDKQEMETTSHRQIRALEQISVPQVIKKYVTGQEVLRQGELEGRAQAELGIKQILFGIAKSSRESAEVRPEWAQENRRARSNWTDCIKTDINQADLNLSQRLAVSTATLRRITLWQGPPGTGKTRTLLAYIRAMVAHNAGYLPILACADTNTAVDNLVQGLMQQFVAPVLDPAGNPVLHANGVTPIKQLRSINVVRIGQAAKVASAVQQRSLDALCEQSELGQKAVEKRKEAASLKEKLLEGIPWEELDRGAKQAIRIRTSTMELEANELLEKAAQEVLGKAEVIAATCTGAGDERTLQGRHFRVVVIDEATQATEPSTLIPLVRGAESVVMAGDPQQLPPTVISMAAAEMGLQSTLFDRLQLQGIQPLLLDQQYRMHPLIAKVPSELFYQGRLRSATASSERQQPGFFPWPNPTCPVALIPCDHGRETTGQSSRTTAVAEAQSGDIGASYKNEEEADIVMRALEVLLDDPSLHTKGYDGYSVALLTPYNGQFRELQRRWSNNSRFNGFENDVVVSSVDGFQGKEAEVVILSTVRCNPKQKLGFVNDYRRMNVAISRPRRGLIVVGSPSTLQANANWAEWLQWVLSYRSILDPSMLDVAYSTSDYQRNGDQTVKATEPKGSAEKRIRSRIAQKRASQKGASPVEKSQLPEKEQGASAGAETKRRRQLLPSRR